MTKNKQKYLIFDFDWTLFNNQSIWDEVVKHSVGSMVFTLKIAQKIDWSKINSKDLVYPEVFEVLENYQDKSYTLFLFSEGDIKGQLYKLKLSKLGKFFPKKQRFIFSQNKMEKFNHLLKKISSNSEIWLFDDKPSKLKAAKNLDKRIKTVLVCHGPWWQTKVANFRPDYKIKNLKELEGIL